MASIPTRNETLCLKSLYNLHGTGHNDSLGPTMEWGFLADLLRRPEALALVDELFIELHFFAPSLNWVHLTHSMKQAFDVLRQLRACGLPVHAWP